MVRTEIGELHDTSEKHDHGTSARDSNSLLNILRETTTRQ